VEKYEPVEILLKQMKKNGVQKALLVQYGGNDDNSYIAECLTEYQGRFSGVAIVNTNKSDAPEKLEYWVKEQGFEGLRIRADVTKYAIWEKIAELNIVASVSGRLPDFIHPRFEAIILSLPNLKLRIEHMGYPDVTEKPPYPQYSRLMSLATKYPNVYIKFSGFYAYSKEPYPYNDTIPFIQLAYEAFSAKRIMWASDFPPVASYEGYSKALEMVDRMPFFTESDKDWILGKTALSLWRFASRNEGEV
ncbi:MAG: amidohydrolase family protein, partial [Planctomycetota bacterium]|jgi:predicted TIM-barrel fold metal-dependent hydrolase